MKKIILSQKQICEIIIHDFSFLNNTISLDYSGSELITAGSIKRIIDEHQYSKTEIIDTTNEFRIWLFYYSKYPFKKSETKIQTSHSYVYIQDDSLCVCLTESDLLSFLIDYFNQYSEEINKNSRIYNSAYAESIVDSDKEISVQILFYRNVFDIKNK